MHYRRTYSIRRRIGVTSNKFLRQIVFTVPVEIRPHFKSKEMLNRLCNSVRRIIEKEFGKFVGQKKKSEASYSLNKKVFASVELFGSQSTDYHPHVNVLILESARKEKKIISSLQLSRIKKRYKAALQKLTHNRLQEVIVHYSYHDTSERLEDAIRYIVKPMNPDLMNHIDTNTRDFLMMDMVGFKFVRFWGEASNSSYLKHLYD